MALRSAPLLLLVLVMVTLRESGVDMEAVASPEAPQIGPSGSLSGASSHSLKYFSTTISEPSQGQPHFVSEGYVDGQFFSYYDSNSWKMQPRVSWMEKVEKVDPQYLERNTQILHLIDEVFGESLEILRSPYNQSEGLHTVQGMYGCELSAEGRKRGFNLYDYDGRNFITFDTDTLTWVVLDPLAKIIQRKWEANPGYKQGKKAYLEEFCIEWLKKYLSYQKEALQRTEPEPTSSESNWQFTITITTTTTTTIIICFVLFLICANAVLIRRRHQDDYKAVLKMFQELYKKAPRKIQVI